jgi:hypothetical protein
MIDLWGYNDCMIDPAQEKRKLTGVQSGVAGEYYVAAELSARGYTASITLRNTRGIDIVCSNADASKSVAIQVKTRRQKARTWMLDQKVEDYYADNLFYVFVTLNDLKQPPDYFIVPSIVVAKYVKTTHQEWLDTPGRGGIKHNDTSVRKFRDADEQYMGRWDLLGL